MPLPREEVDQLERCRPCPLPLRLARRSLRLPLFISLVLCLINLGIVQFGVKDTLPKSRRKPFAWRAANPLAFVTLFRRGAKLRRLCLFSVLSSLERNNRSLQAIYRECSNGRLGLCDCCCRKL